MLKTRIITALVLLAVLLPVLYFNNYTAFAVVATVFFGAAVWECFRLFNPGTEQGPVVAAVLDRGLCLDLLLHRHRHQPHVLVRDQPGWSGCCASRPR
jgi:CDP-diglyceride synthetase